MKKYIVTVHYATEDKVIPVILNTNDRAIARGIAMAAQENDLSWSVVENKAPAEVKFKGLCI